MSTEFKFPLAPDQLSNMNSLFGEAVTVAVVPSLYC